MLIGPCLFSAALVLQLPGTAQQPVASGKETEAAIRMLIGTYFDLYSKNSTSRLFH
jgi:hypothetical protein